MFGVNEHESAAMAEARELVDDVRDSCLWFLRRDDYPWTRADALCVRDAIARRGDVAVSQRAARLGVGA